MINSIKIAKAISLSKKGPKIPSNYSPTSLKSAPSKGLERNVNVQETRFLLVHGFLFSLQWVSKKSFNCSWSSESEKTVKNTLDNKMIGYIIFIDLQMAMTLFIITFCFVNKGIMVIVEVH